MAYLCNLGTGQQVYLDNQGTQTIVTIISGGPGQQQQASSGVSTGRWSEPPTVFRTDNGVILQINSETGKHFIQLQGSSMGVMSQSPSLSNAQQLQVQQTSSVSGQQQMEPMEPMEPMKPMQPMQPMEPMKPMQPMQPMKMGDMEMSMNPMQMRMGNMELSMGKSSKSNQSQSGSGRHFCTQCGSPVQPSDRFCASCGNRLE